MWLPLAVVSTEAASFLVADSTSDPASNPFLYYGIPGFVAVVLGIVVRYQNRRIEASHTAELAAKDETIGTLRNEIGRLREDLHDERERADRATTELSRTQQDIRQSIMTTIADAMRALGEATSKMRPTR